MKGNIPWISIVRRVVEGHSNFANNVEDDDFEEENELGTINGLQWAYLYWGGTVLQRVSGGTIPDSKQEVSVRLPPVSLC